MFVGNQTRARAMGEPRETAPIPATAREVDVLARTRTALEMPARDAQLVERCARMHHNGIELLRRAISALASLSSSGATDPALERGRLSELVREMEAEAAARFAAALEVSSVLRPPG